MAYKEDDALMLSGIQHFAFCRRQWALIHIEEQWSENHLTTSGRLMHDRAHDESITESRGDRVIVRGLHIRSAELGLVGICDVVEFHRSDTGIPLKNRDGLWIPYPIEYKRGTQKQDDCDELQLCAQAMCLEEMLCCTVPSGALFYGETKRRSVVDFSEELRERTKALGTEMHELFKRRHTPQVRVSKKCDSCSLKDICLPKLSRVTPASEYLKKALEDDG